MVILPLSFQSFRFHQYHDLVSDRFEFDGGHTEWDVCLSSDFHGAWQHFTGLNAPLYRRYDEFDIDATLNQVASSTSLHTSVWSVRPSPGFWHRYLAATRRTGP